jgi:glycosyltransferase involved in cell wall biosynthesis
MERMMALDALDDVMETNRLTRECELTILMPCLNESETIVACIEKANVYLKRAGVVGEILIADNGSTDGSQALAEAHGARVVAISRKGYGSALIGGIRAARGQYVIMGDSDDSYDFSELDEFVAKLREGFDLVMGNRFKGGIKPGAMPPLHRYLGNPVLTAIGRLFFPSPCGDFHCGLRGFNRNAILKLGLQSEGMEFASEMVVKASIRRLRITEVPTVLWPDGRSRPPHLRSWRDGWRHLRFLLLFCPRWLFLYPGAALCVFGIGGMAVLFSGPRQVGAVTFDIHTIYYSSLGVIVGFQSILFWVCANLYGIREGLIRDDIRFMRAIRLFSLEACLIVALVLLAVGLSLGITAISLWSETGFGGLSPVQMMRLVIPSGTAIICAFQLAYAAFFVNVLGLRATPLDDLT